MIHEGNSALGRHDQCVEDGYTDYMPTPEEIEREKALIKAENIANIPCHTVAMVHDAFTPRIYKSRIDQNRRGKGTN